MLSPVDRKEIVDLLHLVCARAVKMVEDGRAATIEFHHADDSDSPSAFCITPWAADGTPGTQKICLGILEFNPFDANINPTSIDND